MPRDAELLARLLKLAVVVAVVVASVEQEAARDLVRTREDVRGDLMRARHRLSKMLLRQGTLCTGSPWTGVNDVWLRSQRFELAGRQIAYESAHETVVLTTERRDRLDAAITTMAADSEYTALTRRLCCLRGISTLTGFGLVVEIGDWTRFQRRHDRRVRRSVPTEHPSGGSRSQGSITRTGNTHARRLLVEAAWHHAPPYRTPGKTMRDRWELAPAAARLRGHDGNPATPPAVAGNHRPEECLSLPTSRSRESSQSGPGRWPCSSKQHKRLSCPSPAVAAARGTNHELAMNSHLHDQLQDHLGGHVRSLDQWLRSGRTVRPAVTNPRISV